MMPIYVVIPMVMVAAAVGYFLAALHFQSGCKTCASNFYVASRTSPLQVRDFLNDVAWEITRAKVLHPGNGHLMVALMEEVGELAKAHLENEGFDRIRCEAKHVACVAARIATESDGDFVPVAQLADKSPLPDLDEADTSWPSPPSRARVGGAA